MLTAERLRGWLVDQPDMSSTIKNACAALSVTPEQIHAAAAGDYWIMTNVYSDTNEPYVALEGE